MHKHIKKDCARDIRVSVLLYSKDVRMNYKLILPAYSLSPEVTT